MTPEQAKRIERLPGNWIMGKDMFILYPKVFWVSDVYILIIDPTPEPENKGAPKKYMWINRAGVMGGWFDGNERLDTIADAKIFLKNKKLENFR